MKQIFKSNDSRLIPYHVARGDALLQDLVNDPNTIRKGLRILEVEYGAGALAYTPDVLHKFEEVLQRRYDTDDGRYNFPLPNYAVYDDPEIATFYGVDSERYHNLIKTQLENFNEITDRLLQHTAAEVALEIPGIALMQNHYRNEAWARYGVAEEAPYSHVDPDVTLFRNPNHDAWNTMARPAATSDKQTTLDLYNAQGMNVYATPFEGWEIDRRDGFYSGLPNEGSATGF
jgi:hypothetical protein